VHSNWWSLLAYWCSASSILSNIDLCWCHCGPVFDIHDARGKQVSYLKNNDIYPFLLISALLLLTFFSAFRWEFIQFPLTSSYKEGLFTHFILDTRIMDVLAVGFLIFATISSCTAILRGWKDK
jgi:hypothetical protein